ncbi:MAG: hypothetical protein ACKV0T_02330, partial [Planctomycetales bacterium]
PEVDRHQNSEFLADSIRAHAGANRPKIAHFHYYRPGLTYYCRERVDSMFAPEDAIDFLNQPLPRYLLTSTHEYEKLAPHLPPGTEVLERLPWFLKQGKGIVLLGRRTSFASEIAPERDARHGFMPASATTSREIPVGQALRD